MAILGQNIKTPEFGAVLNRLCELIILLLTGCKKNTERSRERWIAPIL